MPRFEPFPGIRYATDPLAEVTAPPYDVLDAADRAALAARHPHNVVRIDLPVGGDDPYGDADRTFRQWQESGVLATDGPSFYLYRMTFADEAGGTHHTLGVVGALGIEAPGEGGVLPHEHTTPKAKSDRLQLLHATAANLSPVWGLSLADGLSKLLDPAGADHIATWHDPDGVEHALWRVVDPEATAAIAETVGSAPVVIADGHHRYATSTQYRDSRRDGAGGAAGPYDLTLTYVVELVDDQLTVQPIHRLLTDVPEGVDLPGALAEWFTAGPLEAQPDPSVVERLVAEGAFGLVTPDGFRLLTPTSALLATEPALDTARLDRALASLPSVTLTYQHGVTNNVRAVTEGRAQAALLLRPVSVAQIAATAHADERMPPKSTFFWPKPRTGIVLRSLG